MINLNELRKDINEKKVERNILKKQLKEDKIGLKKYKTFLKRASEARIIIQKAVEKTQNFFEFHFSEIVSDALKSVYKNPYAFHMKFVTRRNSTECDLYLTKDGYTYNNILFDTGGGIADIISLALKVSYILMLKTARKILIFDEPFKNINDPSRELHMKAAEMVSQLSKRCKIQFIMVSQLDEMIEVADRIFESKIIKGINQTTQVKI